MKKFMLCIILLTLVFGNGIAILNSQGNLRVTTSDLLGDFNLYGSKSDAYRQEVNPVQEPATILLMGFGLLGLAVVLRKKMLKPKNR